MLSYQQKNQDKHYNFNKILTYSFAIHFFLIILTFFISTIKKNGNAIVIDLSNKSSSAAFVSFKRKSKNGISGLVNKSGHKILRQKNILNNQKVLILKKDKNKILVKNKNKVKKEIVREIKKTEPKVKKTKNSKKKLSRNLIKEEVLVQEVLALKEIKHELKAEPKIETKIEDKKESPEVVLDQSEQDEPVNTIDDNSLVIDLDQIGDLDTLDRSVHDAIISNYYMPPGFDSDIKYIISFEISFAGEIKNITQRTDEPLALYTSIKQAILKAEFPRQKWGSRIELVY